MSAAAPAIEITEDVRDLYGGDIEITSTVPAVHPLLRIPLAGTRESVKGASFFYHTFFRGDIVYIKDPTLEFNFAWWDDNGSEDSTRMYMLMTIEKGFTECEAKDWNIRPILRRVIEQVDGRLVIRARRNLTGKDEYHVLYYRSRERWQLEKDKLHQVDLASEADRQIAAAISDKGVSVLPTSMTASEHKYDVGQVSFKGRS